MGWRIDRAAIACVKTRVWLWKWKDSIIRAHTRTISTNTTQGRRFVDDTEVCGGDCCDFVANKEDEVADAIEEKS